MWHVGLFHMHPTTYHFFEPIRIFARCSVALGSSESEFYSITRNWRKLNSHFFLVAEALLPNSLPEDEIWSHNFSSSWSPSISYLLGWYQRLGWRAKSWQPKEKRQGMSRRPGAMPRRMLQSSSCLFAKTGVCMLRLFVAQAQNCELKIKWGVNFLCGGSKSKSRLK